MAKRKGIGPKVRFEVFKRDRFTCAYCGRTPPTVVLQVDHVIPVCDGGGNEAENLITSCEDCNAGKGGNALGECPATVADKMERAKEVRAQVEQYNEMLLDLRTRQEAVIDRLSDYWFGHIKGGDDFRFTSAPRSSIRRFLDDLTEVAVMDSMDLAHSRKPATISDDGPTWKYFCGICWRKIKDD